MKHERLRKFFKRSYRVCDYDARKISFKRERCNDSFTKRTNIASKMHQRGK